MLAEQQLPVVTLSEVTRSLEEVYLRIIADGMNESERRQS